MKSSSDHETVALSAAGGSPVECIFPVSVILGRLPEASVALGAICLAAKAIIGSSVDQAGILHEPFFLLPIGLALVALGLVAWTAKKL